MRFAELQILLSPLFALREFRGTDTEGGAPSSSSKELAERHFTQHSDPAHINRVSLERALALLGDRPARILETGSSAWGTNSSRLFDRYVRHFGGEFVTIDIRVRAATNLRAHVSSRTTMWIGDSLRVLKELVRQKAEPFDLVYLDSFDLDVTDPLPSMLHGFGEFMLLERLTKPGSIIVVDDTPKGWDDYARAGGKTVETMKSPFGDIMPGKGALVARFLDSSAYEIIAHDYQLTLRRLQ